PPPPLEGGGWGEGFAEERASGAILAPAPPPNPLPQGEGELCGCFPPSRERLDETVEEGGQLLISVRLDLEIGADRFQNRRLARPELGQQLRFEGADAADLNLVEIAAHAGEDRRHLLLDRHRAV